MASFNIFSTLLSEFSSKADKLLMEGSPVLRGDAGYGSASSVSGVSGVDTSTVPGACPLLACGEAGRRPCGYFGLKQPFCCSDSE